MCIVRQPILLRCIGAPKALTVPRISEIASTINDLELLTDSFFYSNQQVNYFRCRTGDAKSCFNLGE